MCCVHHWKNSLYVLESGLYRHVSLCFMCCRGGDGIFQTQMFDKLRLIKNGGNYQLGAFLGIEGDI